MSLRRLGRGLRHPKRAANKVLGQKVDKLVRQTQSVSDIRDSIAAHADALLRLEQTLNKVMAHGFNFSGPTRRFWKLDSLATPVRLETGLERYGRKKYSQTDEDGIIEYIFSRIEGTPGFFVEFGVGPPDGHPIETAGLECNSRVLLENGWHGLFMDGRQYPPEFQVKNERITALNINSLLAKYGVPLEFDFMSIDVDGQDFWIWSMLSFFPRVIAIEYNPSLWIDESRVMPLDPSYVWDGTQYYGASLLALTKLGRAKGYTLLYANGVNAFFVRTDLISNPEDFRYEDIYNYRGTLRYHRADPLNRSYLPV